MKFSIGGNHTYDNIFLLSIDEVEKYFYQSNMRNDNKRLATRGTNYSKTVDNNGLRLSITNSAGNWHDGNSHFFLRTPGEHQYEVVIVRSDGYLEPRGYRVNADMDGIRPAMWVNISSVDTNSITQNNSAVNTIQTNQTNSDLSNKIRNAKVVTQYNADTTVDHMDTVTFGSYPQSDTSGNTKEPIEWIILEKQGNRALLLSKYILDCKCYNNEDTSITYENSSIRNWLNGYFVNTAFINDEKLKIVLQQNSHDDNTNFNRIVVSNPTTDNVFLLSINDIAKYFYNNNYEFDINKKLLAKGTNYAKSINNNGQKLNVMDVYEAFDDGNAEHVKEEMFRNGYSKYWLSDIMIHRDMPHWAAYIDDSSLVDDTGIDDLVIGVRPAIWVSY